MIELSAANIAFDTKELEVAADTAGPSDRLHQQRRRRAQRGDLDEDNEEVFRSDDVTGPEATGDLRRAALPAGEYTFICDFHPGAGDDRHADG